MDVLSGFEGVDSGSEGVDLGSDGVDLGSEGVDWGSEGVDWGSEGVDWGSEGVDLGSEGVEWGSDGLVLLCPGFWFVFSVLEGLGSPIPRSVLVEDENEVAVVIDEVELWLSGGSPPWSGGDWPPSPEGDADGLLEVEVAVVEEAVVEEAVVVVVFLEEGSLGGSSPPIVKIAPPRPFDFVVEVLVLVVVRGVAT